MTVYHFDNSAVIDHVEVTHSAGGRHTAYIRARENAGGAALEQIKKSLTHAEMQWTPVKRNDEYVLEVRNIGNTGKSLLHFLADEGVVSGEPRKEVNPATQVKAWDKFRANTLRWSGLAYFFGDMNFVAYGWKKAFTPDPVGGRRKLTNPQLLLAGLFYAAGSPFISIFGTGDKSDMQLRNMSFDTLQYLVSTGVKIPENSSLLSVTHKHNATPWRKLVSKFERYPSEIANSLFGLAGIMVIWEGGKDLSKFRREAKSGQPHARNASSIIMDMGLGLMSFLAGLVSDLVPEEPRKEGEPRKPGLAGAWQWVQEKPLRTAGYLLGASTVSHAGSSAVGYVRARKILADPNSTDAQRADALEEKRALPNRAIFAVGNMAAEGLMSVSSKGHGKGVESDSSLEPSMYAVMADMILRSQKEDREKILTTVSDHLSQPDFLNLSRERIRKGIEDQMADLMRHPWMGINAPVKTESKAQEEPAQKNTKWQDSVANSVNTTSVSPTV